MLELLKKTGKESYKTYAEKYGDRAGELSLYTVGTYLPIEIRKDVLFMV